MGDFAKKDADGLRKLLFPPPDSQTRVMLQKSYEFLLRDKKGDMDPLNGFLSVGTRKESEEERRFRLLVMLATWSQNPQGYDVVAGKLPTRDKDVRKGKLHLEKDGDVLKYKVLHNVGGERKVVTGQVKLEGDLAGIKSIDKLSLIDRKAILDAIEKKGHIFPEINEREESLPNYAWLKADTGDADIIFEQQVDGTYKFIGDPNGQKLIARLKHGMSNDPPAGTNSSGAAKLEREIRGEEGVFGKDYPQIKRLFDLAKKDGNPTAQMADTIFALRYMLWVKSNKDLYKNVASYLKEAGLLGMIRWTSDKDEFSFQYNRNWGIRCPAVGGDYAKLLQAAQAENSRNQGNVIDHLNMRQIFLETEGYNPTSVVFSLYQQLDLIENAMKNLADKSASDEEYYALVQEHFCSNVDTSQPCVTGKFAAAISLADAYGKKPADDDTDEADLDKIIAANKDALSPEESEDAGAYKSFIASLDAILAKYKRIKISRTQSTVIGNIGFPEKTPNGDKWPLISTQPEVFLEVNEENKLFIKAALFKYSTILDDLSEPEPSPHPFLNKLLAEFSPSPDAVPPVVHPPPPPPADKELEVELGEPTAGNFWVRLNKYIGIEGDPGKEKGTFAFMLNKDNQLVKIAYHDKEKREANGDLTDIILDITQSNQESFLNMLRQYEGAGFKIKSGGELPKVLPLPPPAEPEPIYHETKLSIVISDASREKLNDYLKEIQAAANPAEVMGARLWHILKDSDIAKLTLEQLVDALLKTKKPLVFAEKTSHLKADGDDWTAEEIRLLGRIGSMIPVKAHCKQTYLPTAGDKLDPPQDVTLLVTNGALLNGAACDKDEVFKGDELDDGKLRTYLEQRLLPLLFAANEDAVGSGGIVVLPSLGDGEFAGPTYKGKLAGRLLKIYEDIIASNVDKLKNIKGVIYDKFEDSFSPDPKDIGGIKFIVEACKSKKGPGQLARPEDHNVAVAGVDFTGCKVYVAVAGDHASFPGNDLYRGSPMTHEGGVGARTNLMKEIVGVEGRTTGSCMIEKKKDVFEEHLQVYEHHDGWENLCKQKKVRLGVGRLRSFDSEAKLEEISKAAVGYAEGYKPGYLEADQPADYCKAEREAALQPPPQPPGRPAPQSPDLDPPVPVPPAPSPSDSSHGPSPVPVPPAPSPSDSSHEPSPPGPQAGALPRKRKRAPVARGREPIAEATGDFDKGWKDKVKQNIESQFSKQEVKVEVVANKVAVSDKSTEKKILDVTGNTKNLTVNTNKDIEIVDPKLVNSVKGSILGILAAAKDDETVTFNIKDTHPHYKLAMALLLTLGEKGYKDQIANWEEVKAKDTGEIKKLTDKLQEPSSGPTLFSSQLGPPKEPESPSSPPSAGPSEDPSPPAAGLGALRRKK